MAWSFMENYGQIYQYFSYVKCIVFLLKIESITLKKKQEKNTHILIAKNGIVTNSCLIIIQSAYFRGGVLASKNNIHICFLPMTPSSIAKLLNQD